jgi:hypothetical protein
MRNFGALLTFIALAMLSWGVYGPVLQMGRNAMDRSSLRPFICVGLAYFVIAVLVPAILLRTRGEVGRWSATGLIWSLAAGAAGALGALGVILALAFRGNPLYVMPLVFGGAPVVNTFLTMYWGKTFRKVSPAFLAGLILVIAGAVIVLLFRPDTHTPQAPAATAQADPAHSDAEPAAEPATKHPIIRAEVRWASVFLFTAMTALAWGVYGPTLHRGQMAMAGSRLRPLLCVGISYFLIAVLVPIFLLRALGWEPDGAFTFSGTLWSLAGGAAGALGALGIIMAFTYGGKPIFVMPLVFGGAPVINTFVSIWQSGAWHELHPMFYAGLIVVAAGAVSVLVFAPKADAHAAPASPQAAEPATHS